MYVTTLLIIALSITVCNCGTLYGMDGTGNFSIYDPITGNKTLVKQFQNLAIQENKCAIDTTAGIFYQLGMNLTTNKDYIYGINVNNGAIVSMIFLNDLFQSPFVPVGDMYMAWDSTLKQAIVIGLDATNTSNWLAVGYTTTNTKIYANFSAKEYTPVIGSPATYDSANSIVWTQFANSQFQIVNFGIHIPSGNIVTGPNPSTLETLSFDTQKSLIVGVGLEPDSLKRTVVNFNPVTLNETVVGPFSHNYALVDGSSQAIDVAGRRIFSSFSHRRFSSLAYLLTIDIDTAQILNSPKLGKDLEAWSLQYMP